MDMFLGIPYCTGDQTRFQRALSSGDLQTAYQILEKMPRARMDNKREEMQRNAVLAIGYRELSKAFFGSLAQSDPTGNQSPPPLTARLEKLAAYEGINPDPDNLAEHIRRLTEYEKVNPHIGDLKGKMQRLERYQEMCGPPEEAQEKFNLLDKYEELGKLDDLKEAQEELGELRAQIGDLARIPGL